MFDKFLKTGKIEDYLKYKKAVNNGATNETRKGNNFKNN